MLQTKESLSLLGYFIVGFFIGVVSFYALAAKASVGPACTNADAIRAEVKNTAEIAYVEVELKDMAAQNAANILQQFLSSISDTQLKPITSFLVFLPQSSEWRGAYVVAFNKEGCASGSSGNLPENVVKGMLGQNT